jgi:hypothetical protein
MTAILSARPSRPVPPKGCLVEGKIQIYMFLLSRQPKKNYLFYIKNLMQGAKAMNSSPSSAK